MIWLLKCSMPQKHNGNLGGLLFPSFIFFFFLICFCLWAMCVYVYVCLCAYMCVDAHALNSPMYEVFSDHNTCLSQSLLTFVLKKTLSLNLQHTILASLDSQFVRDSISYYTL